MTEAEPSEESTNRREFRTRKFIHPRDRDHRGGFTHAKGAALLGLDHDPHRKTLRKPHPVEGVMVYDLVAGVRERPLETRSTLRIGDG